MNRFVPTGTCASNQYIKQINADGTVECANVPYHWGVNCLVGEYIESIATDGTPLCKNHNALVANKTCPEDYYLRGFDLDGNLICEEAQNGSQGLKCHTVRRFEEFGYGMGFVEDNGSVSATFEELHFSDVVMSYGGATSGGATVPNTRIITDPLSTNTAQRWYSIECRIDKGFVMLSCAHSGNDDDSDFFMTKNGCHGDNNDGDRKANHLDIRCCK